MPSSSKKGGAKHSHSTTNSLRKEKRLSEAQELKQLDDKCKHPVSLLVMLHPFSVLLFDFT